MNAEVFTVTKAKPLLGSLVDRALRLEPVFIRRGDQLVQLVPIVMPSPFPIYPVGVLTRTDSAIAAVMTTFAIDEAVLLTLR